MNQNIFCSKCHRIPSQCCCRLIRKTQEKDVTVEPIPFAGLVTIVEPSETTITNKRYCTSCQVMRPADYGKMIKAGKITRWKCTACFERINVPRYGRKAKEI